MKVKYCKYCNVMKTQPGEGGGGGWVGGGGTINPLVGTTVLA